MLACTLWLGVSLKVLPLPQPYFCFRATDGFIIYTSYYSVITAIAGSYNTCALEYA